MRHCTIDGVRSDPTVANPAPSDGWRQHGAAGRIGRVLLNGGEIFTLVGIGAEGRRDRGFSIQLSLPEVLLLDLVLSFMRSLMLAQASPSYFSGNNPICLGGASSRG